MPRRLNLWAASLVESSWLAALLATPVLYNVYSYQTFEPDKVFLLRSLTALTLAAAIVWCAATGRAAWTIAGRSLWHVPLVKPFAALTAAYILATVCSIAPRLSLWGSYERVQGLYTWLSYVTVFLAIVLVARERERWERIVEVVLLASVPVALYAIFQHFNADPIDWAVGPRPRATSTAGNPIFAGAFLIMVVPVTLARMLAQPVYRGAEGLVRGTPYVVLLIVQILALYYTQSRGPTFGLACGLAAFVLLAAWLRQMRWPVLVVGGVAVLAALVVFSTTATLGVRPTSGFERLRRMFPSQDGSGRVRLLTWQAVTELLRRDPVRAVIGHGPETMLLAFAPVYPPGIVNFETPEVAPDRAHNEVLDALVTIGATGCVAELVVIVTLLFHILRWLGVLTTPARSRWFLGMVLSGAMVGGLTPLVTGQVAFVGIGLSLGMVTGVLAYLVGLATRRPKREGNLADADCVLLAALFAAVLGHFVELQLGIGTSSTHLYFCAFAGLTVAIGLGARDTASANASVQPAALGAIVALLLILATIDFYTPTARIALAAAPVAASIGVTWLFGAWFAAESQPRAIGSYAAVSVALWLVFIATFASWTEATRALTMHPTPVEVLGARLADTVSVVYVAVGVCVTLLAFILTRRPPNGRGTWPQVTAAVAVLSAAIVVGAVNLQLARADCWTKLGDRYERQGAWSNAVAAHERALRIASRQEYTVNLARALIGRARAVAQQDGAQRDADAARAIELTEGVAQANPLNPDHPSNLARLYRKWARIGDASSRMPRFERADAAYRQALALWPTNPALWNEVALLHIERGQAQQMMETFARSLRLNDHFVDTYVRRAQVFVALNRLNDAAADYRLARRWDPALPYSPMHLANVYRETDQVERALAEAQTALPYTTGPERQLLQELITTLEKRRTTPAGGR